MTDELYEVRNSVYVGNFHQAIAEGSAARSHSKKHEEVQAFTVERDFLVGSAQIGLGQFDNVLTDQRNAVHPALVALRHWAQLHKELSQKRSPEEPLAALDSLIKCPPSAQLASVAALVASAHAHCKDVTSAMKIAVTWATGLADAQVPRAIVELRAVTCDCCLRINRVDLAEKELKFMTTADDESTLTILYNGIVALRQGVTKPERYNDAVSSFTDLSGRCGQSVLVLNLLALARLGQGKAADAERCLLDALSKRSGDPDTIANLAMVSSQLGKSSEISQRYISQAKSSPNSVWCETYMGMEERFKDACSVSDASM